MTSDTVITRRSDEGTVTAVVRSLLGVFDVQRFDNCWVCSCGRRDCSHVAAVEEALADRAANGVQ
ncbi:MAG: hypothetical protein WB565_10050 [Acidimicrobiales bacterium]